MNKALLAGLLVVLVIGISGVAVAQDGDRLNSVYGYDDGGDFYVILFAEDATHTFGTVSSLVDLNQETAQVCQQWVTESSDGGWWIFGDDGEEASTYVECQDLRMDTRPQGQQLPPQIEEQQNQTQNQT